MTEWVSDNKKVEVTKIPGLGWHHTEIVTEEGSIKQHFTNENTDRHYYLKPSEEFRTINTTGYVGPIPRRVQGGPL